MIEFWTDGRPQTKGSTKGFGFVRKHGPRAGSIGVNITNDNVKAKGWAQLVAMAARSAYHGAALEGPMCVGVTFHLPRPKSHSGKRGLKPGAPRYPIAKERDDTDKLVRCALDAITGIAWVDDSQVVKIEAAKVYATGDRIGAAFSIAPMEYREDAVKGTEF